MKTNSRIPGPKIKMVASEKVNHPNHYNKGKIEVIDFIADQKLDFCEGNVVKYVCRHKHKNGLEDVKKALFYLNYLVQLLEGEQNEKSTGEEDRNLED